MKYMLLIYSDERSRSDAEMEQTYASHRLYGEAMHAAGVMRGGAELKPAAASTCTLPERQAWQSDGWPICGD